MTKDEKYLFIFTFYNIQVYELNSLKLYKDIPLLDIKSGDGIRDFSLSSDAKNINIFTTDKSLYRLNIKSLSYRQIARKSDYPNGDYNIEFDNNQLIIYNYKKTKDIYLYDINKAQLTKTSMENLIKRGKKTRRILCTSQDNNRYVKKERDSYDVYDKVT